MVGSKVPAQAFSVKIFIASLTYYYRAKVNKNKTSLVATWFRMFHVFRRIITVKTVNKINEPTMNEKDFKKLMI